MNEIVFRQKKDFIFFFFYFVANLKIKMETETKKTSKIIIGGLEEIDRDNKDEYKEENMKEYISAGQSRY